MERDVLNRSVVLWIKDAGRQPHLEISAGLTPPSQTPPDDRTRTRDGTRCIKCTIERQHVAARARLSA
jgi:hypothetical protein